jgi:hypothetical protein
VTLNGAAIPRQPADGPGEPGTGWRMDERGFVVLQMPDRFEPVAIALEF